MSRGSILGCEHMVIMGHMSKSIRPLKYYWNQGHFLLIFIVALLLIFFAGAEKCNLVQGGRSRDCGICNLVPIILGTEIAIGSKNWGKDYLVH